MKKKLYFIMIALMTVLLCACGSDGGKSLDLSEYRGGAKLESLLDENTYKKNGSKMVKALENMIDASPNDFHMLSRDPKLFDKAVAFEEVFEESDCEYYYVGKIKDKKPDGYGVLTSGYKEDDLFVYYIGEFKNGAIKDCYGMILSYGHGYMDIEYEGDLAYIAYSELEPIPADGEQQLLYDIQDLYYYYGYSKNISDEELNANKYVVSRCIPYYIGEIKNGKPNGKGIYYDMDGEIEYEGEVKNGKKHGKGKVYYNGELIREGTFKNGKLEDGKVYREVEEDLGSIVEERQEVSVETVEVEKEENTEIENIDIVEEIASEGNSEVGKINDTILFKEELTEKIYYGQSIIDFINDRIVGGHSNSSEILFFTEILYQVEENLGVDNISAYTIIDLDKDEKPEIILEVCGQKDTYYLIINYHEDTDINLVISKGIREFSDLSMDGVYMTTNGADSWCYCTLDITEPLYPTEEIIASADNGYYEVYGECVDEETFNQFCKEIYEVERATWVSYTEDKLAKDLKVF